MDNLLLNNLSSIECLGLTIIGEARGESVEGQVAVASVIRNRLHSQPNNYKSYNDVCFAKSQFSCWNLNDPNRPLLLDLAEQLLAGQKISDPYLRQCFWVATGIFDWAIRDNTKGALNYIEKTMFETNRPSWAKNVKTMKQVGNHIFFTA